MVAKRGVQILYYKNIRKYNIRHIQAIVGSLWVAYSWNVRGP